MFKFKLKLIKKTKACYRRVCLHIKPYSVAYKGLPKTMQFLKPFSSPAY